MHICESGLFEITLQSNNVAATQIELIVTLPQGIEYLSGTVQNASEAPNLNPANPSFEIASLEENKAITIRFEARVLCDAIDQINSGSLFLNIISINYNGNSASVTTNPYRVETPLVILESVNPISLQGTQYDVLTRNIVIKNTRLGRVSSIEFTDRHSGGITISTSLANGVQTGNTYTGTIGAAEFSTIGNGDDYLDLDEVLILEETILITDCGTQPFSDSDISIDWGCFGQTCGTDFLPARVNILANPNFPELTVESTSSFPAGLCLDEAFKEELIIANTGTDTTRNLQIDLTKAIPSGFGIEINSFNAVLNGESVPVMLDNYTPFEFENCTYPGTFGDTLALIIDTELAPGETLVLNFDLYACQETCDEAAPLYFYNIQYDFSCPPGSTKDVSGSNRLTDYSSVLLDSVTFNLGVPLQEGGSYPLFYKVKSDLLTDSLGFFKVNFELPCGMIWHNSPFRLGGKDPLSVTITPENGVTSVAIIFELPFYTDSVETQFNIGYACRDTCIDLMSPTLVNFNSSCTNATYTCAGGVCTTPFFNRGADSIPVGIIDLFTVRTRSEIIPDLNMPECAIGDCDEFDMYWQCDTIADLETGKIRGYVEPQGFYKRQNLGLADADDDRMADMPLQTAEENQVRTDRVIAGDTSLTKTYGVITVDEPGATFNFASFKVIYAGFKSDAGREGGQTGFDYQQNGLFKEGAFDEIETTVRVVDANTGNIYEAPIQRSLVEEDQYGRIEVINTRPTEILDEWYYLYLEYQVDPAQLTSFGFPADFVFEEGDSLIFEAKHIVDFNPLKNGPQFINMRNTGLISIYDTFGSPEWSFSCGFSETRFQITGYRLALGAESFTLVPCETSVNPNTTNFDFLLATPNFFTAEVREFVRVNNWEFYFPGIVSHEETWLGSIDLQGGINLHALYQYPGLGPGSPIRPDLTLFDEPIRDEGYSMLFTHTFSGGDCIDDSRPTNLRLELEFSHNFPEYPDFLDTVSTNLSGANIQNPSLSTFIPSNAIVATGSQVSWQVDLRNLGPGNASNVWFLTGEGENLYNVRIVDKLTGDTLMPVNGIIQFGSLSNREEIELEIITANGGCGGRDSIQIAYGWNCEEYAGAPGEIPCEIKTAWLKVKTLPAELEMDIDSPTEPFHLCDTVPFHTVEVFNANFNPANNLELELLLPLGLELLTGSCEISYPKGSPFTSIADPTFINNGVYKWAIADISPAIAQNGLPGYVNAPENNFQIRFKSITDCGFIANSPVIFKVSGKNNNCPVPTNVLAKPGNLLEVEGLDADYTGQFFTSGSQVEEITCGEDYVLQVRFRNIGTTGLKDSLFITLPAGAYYVPGSLLPLTNAPATEPQILLRGDYQVLKWAIPANLGSNNLVSFDITIRNLYEENCGSASFYLQALQTKEAVCSTTGEICDAKIATGDFSLQVTLLQPDLNWQSLSGSFPDGPDGGIVLEGSLLNSGFMVNNPVIRFYLDNNGNGNPDAGDTFITEAFLGTMEEGDSRNFQIPGQIDPTDICKVIGWIPAADNCLCDPKVITIDQTAVSHRDTVLCSGEPATFGTDFQTGHEYFWTIANPYFSCTDCPRGEFRYNNNDDVVADFHLQLEEDIDACKVIYDYWVYVQPTLSIASTNDDICSGESLTLEAEAAQTYNWSGPGITAPNQQAITVSPTQSTTYYLTLTDTAGCTSNDSVFVLVHPLPKAEAGADKVFCADGGDHRLQAFEFPGYSYTWFPANLFQVNVVPDPFLEDEEDGTAILQVMDPVGCTAYDTISFTFIEQPVLLTQENVQACIGEVFTLLVEGAETYEWTPATGLSCNDCPNPVFTPTEPETYTVTGTNGGLCRDTKTVTVDILGEITSNSRVQYFCPTDTIFFNGQALTDEGYYCDTLIHPITSCDSIFCLELIYTDQETEESNILCEGDTLDVFGDFITNPGTFCETFMSSTGCDSTHCIQLNGAPRPDIRLQEYTYTLEKDSSVMVSLEPGFEQYIWSPSVGLGCDTCAETIITAQEDSISYEVEVFNEFGCSVTIRVNIDAVDKCAPGNLVIPNVFTPNGDTHNDLFQVTGELGVEQISKMQIFNRWGEKIYEGFGSRAVWDGTIEGVAVPSDVYMYQIEVGCYDDKEVLAGDITVLR